MKGKGFTKRLLAAILSIALAVGNVPLTALTSVQAAETETVEIDLGRPTAGAKYVADGTIGGIGDSYTIDTSETYQLTTSFAGSGWKLNSDRTIVPKVAGDDTLYVQANTSTSWVSGAYVFKWASKSTYDAAGARTAMYINGGNTVALDFTAPSAGEYRVEVYYWDQSSTRGANFTINDTLFENAIPTGDSANLKQKLNREIGTVTLNAGEYANKLDITAVFTGRYATAPRAIVFTKVESTPAPTLAPTATPTVEPSATAAPTAAPTAEPVATGTPTPAPTASATTAPTVLDFGRPTTGVVLVDDTTNTLVGITDDTLKSAGYYWLVTTSYAGNGWKLNVGNTTMPIAEEGGTIYQRASASKPYAAGAQIQGWKGGNAVLSFNYSTTAAFDFTVPEAGTYKVEARYYNRAHCAEMNIKIGDEYSTTIARGVDTVKAFDTIQLGTVTLSAGNYANTIEITQVPASTGTGDQARVTMLRSITLTKVDDTATPTAAPTPTATPATPAPTAAPTAAPTPMPTATPMPTDDPNVTKTPFRVSMEDVDTNSLYTADGERFYFTNDTVGSNWVVGSPTNSGHLVTGTSTSSRARVFFSNGAASYAVLYKWLADFSFEFEVTNKGRYDLSSNVVWGEKMGYADVYLNGTYVGTLDGNTIPGTNEQKLLGVYLNEGKNTLTIKISEKNAAGYNYFSFKDFQFTTPETIATLTGIEIIPEETSMFIGDTQTLVTNGTLTNGGLYRLSSAGATVSYESDNQAVATVSSDGVVTAVSAGTAKITATSNLNGGYTDVITITVKEITYETPEINIEEGWIFTEGDTLTLVPKAKLSNDTYADTSKVTATYDSSDEDVAKVVDGVLTAVAPGEAKITAHITYNGKTLDVERNIKVNEKLPEEAFEVDLTVAAPMIVDAEGERFYFTKDTVGSNWSISSKTEAPLATSQDSVGNCRFFPSDTKNYFSIMTGKKFVIDVNVPIAGRYDITANMRQSTTGGYAAVFVNDLYVGTISSYAETTIDYVKQNLLGVSLHAGKNEIVIMPTKNGEGGRIYTTIIGFSFSAPAEIATLTAIDASADVEEMYVGRTEQITVDAILSNGGFYEIALSEETLKYESSDPAVATVSNTGLIKGVGGGQVTITVTAEKSGLQDTLVFDVSDAAFDKAEVNITEGEVLYVMAERELAVVATLADGTPIAQKDLTITYSSSNDNVAKIENGVLKVVAVGNATITADVKFNVTGETKSDVKNIVAETIPLTGITAKPAKSVVQELDWDGVQLIVQGVAYDGTIIEDLEVAGFAQRDFTYEALTPEILTIDANGICKYVSRGTAQVKVSAVLDGVPFEQVVDVVSSSQKTGRTLYTDEMIENARYNAKNTSWGVKEVKRVSGQSYRFVYSFEHIYDLIFAEGIPRSYENSTLDAQHDIKQYCPACGTNIEVLYGGEWETNILENPWKIWCPHCKMKFPSNDFELLYKRGLDENGKYNRELAYQRNAEAVARGEKDALINELYPDKGPLWMVDDGFGWSPTSGTYGTNDRVQYTPIAKYAHDFWFQGSFSYMGYILYKIRDIYLWTGDERYAVAGCILLDRVADVYPTYDVRELGIGYHISHGGGNSGQTVGSIQENYLAQYYAECYDAFYPEFDNPQVIEFLSKKAVELNLDNPKTNGNLIRENIENGILRETMDAVRGARIYGNFGFHQAAMVKAAVALDTQPETDEALTWLISPSILTKERTYDPTFDVYYNARVENTGGEFVTKYVNEIDRDGFGAEISTTYNKIWMNSGVEIADILRNYGTDVLDLYQNPKFVNMYDSFIYMTAGDGYTLALGDGGKVCEAGWTTFKPEVARGFRALRTPLLAQVYDAYVSGKYGEMVIDFYTDQKKMIVSMQAAVAEHGKLELESRNLTGYGLAMVRGGKAGTKESTYETRYDTWMYYGRTTGSHAHWDMLQLGIDAYGFDFTPDQGYPEATGNSAHRYEWVKASISHNLVLVNEDSQTSIYTGTPLHFDSTDNVKLIDVEAPTVYEDTEIYRRTAISVSVNEDVAYTVDLFRVKGGNAHTYSFHTQGYKGWSTDDLNLVPQVDENGAYVGTYAGPDVPFGPDPLSTDTQYAVDPVYPRGYTWITEVNRGTDKTGDGLFTIDFKQTNFKHQVADAVGLALKVHAVNDWVADSVDIGVGSVTRKPENEMIPGLDHLLIQRRGENLDTLFATVLEPYKINSYIVSVDPITATIKSGTEGVNDISKVIKVTLANRIDYIIYATNKDVVYTVTDGNVSFDFSGFVGVYSVDGNGNNVYSYVNDGTIIGNETSIGAYTGTVVDFTKELVLDDYIIIKPDQEIEDLSVLENQYIYVDNSESEVKTNGAYRILSAKKQGENISLYLGNCSLIDSYIDDYNLDAGFVYTIADGQSFRIPVSTIEGSAFTGTNRPASGGTSTPAGTEATEEATTAEETVVEAEDNMVPNEGAGTGITDITDDPAGEEVVKPTEAPSEGAEGGNGEGTPTPDPDATDASTGGNGVRNILLAGLGLAALVAGFFLILLGKKKDEDEEEA